MKKATHGQLAQWLEAARQGDEAAFRALYDATAPLQKSRALGILKDPELAGEAVQESYLAFFRSMGNIHSGKAVVAYLNKTTYYACLAVLRREKRPTEGEQALLTLAEPEENGPEAQADRSDRQRRLRAALDSLPDRQRQAVQLRYYQGKKLAETAREMGCSQSTVQRLLREAQGALRTALRGGLLTVLPLGVAMRVANRAPQPARRVPRWAAAAAVLVVGALTAAVWQALPPAIQSAEAQVSDPANAATIAVRLGGRTADRVRLIDAQGGAVDFAPQGDGLYLATARQNGTYRVEAAAGSRLATTSVAVDALDTEAPALLWVEREGSDTLIALQDSGSGVDWASAVACAPTGEVYAPQPHAEGEGVVRFSLPPGRYTLKVRDLAGNWAQGPLQVLG